MTLRLFFDLGVFLSRAFWSRGNGCPGATHSVRLISGIGLATVLTLSSGTDGLAMIRSRPLDPSRAYAELSWSRRDGSRKLYARWLASHPGGSHREDTNTASLPHLKPIRLAQATEAMWGPSPLGDGIQIFGFPLILSAPEADFIQRGARQRLRALALFFQDIALGDQRAFRGPSPLVPQKLVDMILHEASSLSLNSLREIWRGHPSHHIVIPYGPDLVRQASGDWVVLEDNVGNVGGFGDISALAQTWRHHQDGGTLPPFLVSAEEESRNLVALFFEGLHERPPRGLAVFPSSIKPSDQEWLRKKSLIMNLGPHVRSLPTPTKTSIFEEARRAPKGEIAFLNGGRLHPSEEQELFFSLPQVYFFFAPGVEMLGHKALLPFVESLIRFYLDETPLLSSASTRILNPSELTSFSGWRNLRYSVVKYGYGSQGHDVFLLFQESLAKVYDTLSMLRDDLFPFGVRESGSGRESPSAFKSPLLVVQEPVTPSVLLDHWIDVRPLALALGPEKTYVTPVPWGRALPVSDPHGKINVSQGAKELVVLAEKSGCGELLLEKL